MKNDKQSSEINIPITDYSLQNGNDIYMISSNILSASKNTDQSGKRLEAYARYIAETRKTSPKL